jgi:serine/threonine protein kinase
MNHQTYEICSQPLGNSINSQVYKIKEKNQPHSLLIAKIYQKKRKNYYEKEERILSKISRTNNNAMNDYLIHLSNINARLDISEQFTADSTLLTFDYLKHGNILDYVSVKTYGKPFCELYAKLLCYKLLLGLKKCHENNIIHNNIDIRNIMFDENFNPIIIHFGDAIISNDHQKDFKGLGLVLAELLTSRQIISYKFNIKLNKYIFKFHSLRNPLQKNKCEESLFWKMVEKTKNIKISKEFIDFFHELTSPDNILNINDLLNNDWLKEAKVYQKEIEKNLKEEFKYNYSLLKKAEELIDNHKVNLNSIMNIEEMNGVLTSNSLIAEYLEKTKKIEMKR